MKITIYRRHLSYNYKRDPLAPDDWGNNDAHNSLDQFILEDDLDMIGGSHHLFECMTQTISNIPGGRFLDTLAPGPFQLCLFVDPRLFHGRIHGIVNARNLNGEWINEHSVTPTNADRMLMHDWERPHPSPSGSDTRVAWSAGCIVVPDLDLVRFGLLMDTLGKVAGDLIDGEIKEG